jgi:hypothetical protein
VLQQPNTHAIREKIAEQSLHERRRARQQLADDDDPELQRDERPESSDVRSARLAAAITSSTISFATQSVATGTPARTIRNTTIVVA